MERPKIGVGVLVVQNGKTLLGKRKGSHGASRWSSPGGHLEFGETIEQCAERELREETGLIPLSLTRGPWTNDIMGDKHYVTLWAFVLEFEGTPKLLEPHKCEGWEWFDWNELPQLLFTPVQNLIKQEGIHQLMNQSQLTL